MSLAAAAVGSSHAQISKADKNCSFSCQHLLLRSLLCSFDTPISSSKRSQEHSRTVLFLFFSGGIPVKPCDEPVLFRMEALLARLAAVNTFLCSLPEFDSFKNFGCRPCLFIWLSLLFLEESTHDNALVWRKKQSRNCAGALPTAKRRDALRSKHIWVCQTEE